jgi:hypothetical protein
MKAKVIIENGLTSIVLTPENDFETDIIEKVYVKKSTHDIHTNCSVEYAYGGYTKHSIELLIRDKNK